jgi:hypothetical protein
MYNTHFHTRAPRQRQARVKHQPVSILLTNSSNNPSSSLAILSMRSGLSNPYSSQRERERERERERWCEIWYTLHSCDNTNSRGSHRTESCTLPTSLTTYETPAQKKAGRVVCLRRKSSSASGTPNTRPPPRLLRALHCSALSPVDVIALLLRPMGTRETPALSRCGSEANSEGAFVCARFPVRCRSVDS